MENIHKLSGDRISDKSMKFLTVFVALLSVAFGYQASWTLAQLDQAISNPATDPNLLPYLEQALNEIMSSLFAEQQITAVSITIPAVDLSTWTLPELSAALQNPTTDPALVPYLEQALNQMMEAMIVGGPVVGAPVVVPAMDVSHWSLHELTTALENPNTNPELVPYLEHAINEIMEALISGHQMESIVIAVPVGLLPVESPVVAIPINPAPVEVPVAPEAPLTPTSPLVQIIVNVNQKATPAAPSPVAPETSKPQPVIIVDEAAPQEPIFLPVNPVDVIAIAPPEINPVDLMHPVPGVVPVAAGAAVIGPIV